MVLIMEESTPKEPPTSRELVCDNRSITAATSISSSSALSPQQTDLQIANDIIKKSMKLELVSPKYEVPGQRDSDSTSGQDEDEMPFKSPKSPSTVENRRATVSHQTSVEARKIVEVAVDDRKALREALYQGIFHRHRRTIFAFGSFIRMFKTRSQYNTIRSSSEGEEDTR